MATLTSLIEIVPSERIEQALRGANLTARLGLLFADARPVPPGTGSSVAVPYPEADPVPAGTKTENAEFDLTTTSMAEATLNAGTVGFSEEVSRELQGEALYAAVELILENKAAHVADRVDSDILANFASASNQSGSSGTDLSEATVVAALFAYMAQNPQATPGGLVFCLSPVMLRDWADDVGTNGGAWTQGSMESERIAGLFKGMPGIIGRRLDMTIAVNTNVPTSGADAIGAIFGAGDRSALLYRVWRTLQAESRYLPRQQCHELTVSLRYATGLARQDDIRGVIADNAA